MDNNYDYVDFCDQVKKNARIMNQIYSEEATMCPQKVASSDNKINAVENFHYIHDFFSSSEENSHSNESYSDSDSEKKESSLISVSLKKATSVGFSKSNLHLKSSKNENFRNIGSVQSDYIKKPERLLNYYVQNTFAAKLTLGSDKLQI